MKKYLAIVVLSVSLFWGNVVKAAESPWSSTKVIEALNDTLTFNEDGTFDITNVTDLTLTGDLTTSLTLNSIPYITTGGLLTEDTTGLVYDGTSVAIGTATSNAAMLHVHTAAAGGGVVAGVTVDDLVVENNNAGGISVLVPNDENARIVLGSPSDNEGAQLRWNHDADLFVVGSVNIGASVSFRSANDAEAMRITSGQQFGFGTSTVNAEIDIWEGGTNTMRVSWDGTGSNTAMLVLDPGGTLQRVLVGPADSAGGGFRTLMMAN